MPVVPNPGRNLETFMGEGKVRGLVEIEFTIHVPLSKGFFPTALVAPKFKQTTIQYSTAEK